MKALGKNTSYERILAHMREELAESDLSDFEKYKLTRLHEAFTFLRQWKTTQDAVALLLKRFPGISKATAYRDCADAISLFGDISKSTKEGIRHLSTELLREAAVLAKAKNDPEAMIKAALAMAKVNGVNITDPDAFNWAALEPHIYKYAVDPITLAAMRQMVNGGKVDLGGIVEAMNANAEEAVIIDDKESPDENT